MKTKRMSLYIVSVILLVIMIVGTLGVATWALLSTKLDVSGKIGFTGTGDVLAIISDGVVDGGVHTAGVMDGFTIDKDYDESSNAKLSSWTNLDLNFNADGSDLVLSFSIKNNQEEASGKYLLVNLDSSAETEGGITMFATAVGKVDANEVVVAPQETVEYNIAFSIASHNKKVSRSFSIVLNFTNEAEPTNVTFVVDGVEQTALVRANQPIGNYFPMDEESTCGYYLNPDFTGLVEADTILTQPIVNLYTATASDNLQFSKIDGGYSARPVSTDVAANYVIPLKYQGEYVVEISWFGSGPFVYDPGYEPPPISILIPHSVTSIGKYAFNGCNLTSITIPSSVTSIGRQAFDDCGLTSITFERTSGTIDIGYAAFASKCTNIDFSGGTWTSGGTSYTAANIGNASKLNSTSNDAMKTWTIS